MPCGAAAACPGGAVPAAPGSWDVVSSVWDAMVFSFPLPGDAWSISVSPTRRCPCSRGGRRLPLPTTSELARTGAVGSRAAAGRRPRWSAQTLPLPGPARSPPAQSSWPEKAIIAASNIPATTVCQLDVRSRQMSTPAVIYPGQGQAEVRHDAGCHRARGGAKAPRQGEQQQVPGRRRPCPEQQAEGEKDRWAGREPEHGQRAQRLPLEQSNERVGDERVA